MGKAKVIPKNKLTRYESFVVEEVGREVLKGTPYNPRRITDDARARLKAKIEKVGLVTPLVWNKRTGNLVGGHQRLSILDELEGRQDYRLRVSVVDVDEREERALNVFLNNQASQGDWDVKALAEIAKEFEGDSLADLGFVAGEIEFLPTQEVETIEEEETGGDGGDTVPRAIAPASPPASDSPTSDRRTPSPRPAAGDDATTPVATWRGGKGLQQRNDARRVAARYVTAQEDR